MSDFPPPPPPGGGGTQPPPPPGAYPPPPGAPPAAPPWAATPPPGYSYGVPVAGYGPQLQYASVGKRIGALLLDGLIVGCFYIPGFIYIFSGPTETYLCDSDLSANSSGFLICERPTGGTWATAIALWGAAFLLGCLYHAMMTGSSGQTIGKRALGVKVVGATTGEAIGFGKALGRALIQGATSLVCGPFWLLDHLWPLWDERKQTLHDKAVGSVVVQA